MERKLRKYELEVITLVGAALVANNESKTLTRTSEIIIKTANSILDVIENDQDILRKKF